MLTDRLKRLLEAARSYKPPPPLQTLHQLVITATPLEPDGYIYQFVLRNNGPVALAELSLNLYEALGPGDFGLDDTHMPASLTAEPKVEIELLEPEAEVKVLRKRWGPMSKYRGPSTKQLVAQIGSSAEGETTRHIINVTISA